MFPNFQNDPNGLPAIIQDAAVLALGFDTGLVTPTPGDTAGYAVVAAYNADGTDVSGAIILGTVDTTAVDGTTVTVTASTVSVTYSGGLTGPITVKLEVPANPAVAYAMESEIAPVAGTPGDTVHPTVPGSHDAGDAGNVPAGITDPVNAVDEKLVNGFAAPDGDANNAVPADLDPPAQKPWN